MKRALMLTSIAVVFGMGLVANAYAGSTESSPFYGFSYYGAENHGAPVEGPSQNWGEGQPQAFRPWLRSSTESSGGFTYYGSGPYTEIQNPERQMQTQFGQAPSSTEGSQGQKSMGTPGSTNSPFYGFSYYGADYHGAPVE